MARPVFILSLPRSGSTLLQRVLGNHPDIATAPEPWFLLPMVYSHADPAAPAEYDEKLSAEAIDGFLSPRNMTRDRLHEGPVPETARRVYDAAAGGKPVFLDKTPRYALIASRLAELFPEAGFVLLWRDPLSVYASIRQTWPYSRTGIATHEIDLYAGLAGLCRFAQEHADRVHTLRFEAFCEQPEEEVRAICAHLGLDNTDDLLTLRDADTTAGSEFGDQTGRARYTRIEPTRGAADTIRAGLCNPMRVAWCRAWLDWIGTERLTLMGYDHDELSARLDAIPFGTRLWFKDWKRERRAKRWRPERDHAVGRSPIQAAAALADGRWPGEATR